MSIKDRIRELEDKVDRIEALTERLISQDAAREIGDKIYEKIIFGDPIEIKCPRFEVNINNDPEIIGNVMRWRGLDYLESKYVPATARPRTMTDFGRLWIKFDDIQITDELACMRTKEQPIWVIMQNSRDETRKIVHLQAVHANYVGYNLWTGMTSEWKHCRLANIDDLKKAMIR